MPISNQPTQSILFVCWGNICRSPAAENVMRKLLEEAGLAEEVSVDSSGTIDAHAGNGPDPRMSEAGRRRGLPMTGHSRITSKADFSRFDMILAMDGSNLADLRKIGGTESANGKVELFCSYCRHHDVDAVPDPYYGGAQGFEHVLDLLEDGCQQILEKLKNERIG